MGNLQRRGTYRIDLDQLCLMSDILHLLSRAVRLTSKQHPLGLALQFEMRMPSPTHEPACACFRPYAEGAAMTEEPSIIRMNIDRYRTMLRERLGETERSRVEQLLAEAKHQLALAGIAK